MVRTQAMASLDGCEAIARQRRPLDNDSIPAGMLQFSTGAALRHRPRCPSGTGPFALRRAARGNSVTDYRRFAPSFLCQGGLGSLADGAWRHQSSDVDRAAVLNDDASTAAL